MTLKLSSLKSGSLYHGLLLSYFIIMPSTAPQGILAKQCIDPSIADCFDEEIVYTLLNQADTLL